VHNVQTQRVKFVETFACELLEKHGPRLDVLRFWCSRAKRKCKGKAGGKAEMFCFLR
jgi:hypothetical protein